MTVLLNMLPTGLWDGYYGSGTIEMLLVIEVIIDVEMAINSGDTLEEHVWWG